MAVRTKLLSEIVAASATGQPDHWHAFCQAGAPICATDVDRLSTSMVALPSNMREAAFLQLRAAYARLCVVHAKLRDRWNEGAYSPDEVALRLRALNELRPELRHTVLMMRVDAA
jgi:hypothetical protein